MSKDRATTCGTPSRMQFVGYVVPRQRAAVNIQKGCFPLMACAPIFEGFEKAKARQAAEVGSNRCLRIAESLPTLEAARLCDWLALDDDW